jgi:hypothetical protein
MIFKMLYNDAQDGYLLGWREASEKELLSPSLFPYSVSRACKAWDHAAAVSSEFWTRIVIRLDLAKPVEAFKVYLARSKNLALHSISIVQPNESSNAPANFEADQVTQIVGLIGKRYTRCGSLFIRTGFTSSIQHLLPVCIQRNTHAHQSITLESHHRDHSLTAQTFPLADGAVKASHLRFISLIGLHYVRLTRNKHWRAALSSLFLDLTVSHLRMEDGGTEPFLFSELWTSLTLFGAINELGLIDVDVPDVDLGEDPAPSSGCTLSSLFTSLNLCKVTSSVLAPLLKKMKEAHKRLPGYMISGYEPYAIDTLIVNDCSLFNCKDLPFAEIIRVSHISSSDSLSLLFAGASSQRMVISDCPGLDNSGLASLTVPFPADDYSRRQRIPIGELHTLYIHNCPNVNLLGLRKLVEFRVSWTEDAEQAAYANLVRTIGLSGLTPAPSAEEIHWFRGKGTKIFWEEPLILHDIWNEEQSQVEDEEGAEDEED